MANSKLYWYLVFLLVFMPVLAQNSTPSQSSELADLDSDPLINQLLNNLSSGGIYSELTEPLIVPSENETVEQSDSGMVTILTPVNPSENTQSVENAQSVTTSPTSPVVANTLSSRLIVPQQQDTNSVEPTGVGGAGQDEKLPTAFAPVPIESTGDSTRENTGQVLPQVQSQTSSQSLQDIEANEHQQPKLFDVAWTDREVYKVNLIPSAWSSLERVPSSSIYHIQLDISEDLRQVDAKQEVLVRNSEQVALDRLYFHLYPNLLGGSIRISQLVVAGQSVPVTTESNNRLLNINLSQPLNSGEAVTVYMEYSVQLPQSSQRNYGLFGMDESILSLGHAYPQLAVFNETGWALDTPPEYGDVVHADTAFYLVEVTAPQAVKVSTTGTVFPNLMARATPVAKQRFTVAAGPVRDFYLSASQNYAIAERTVGQTKLKLYYPRTIHSEVRPRVDALLDQAAASLLIFSERLQAYPYTELDVSAIATGALGVEYPSIIGMTTRFFDNSIRLYGYDLNELLESTIVHEVGHQWFYGTVGNNQVTEPWLDESLTQYITLLYYLDRYGEPGANEFRRSLQERWSTGKNARKSIDLETQDYSSREYAAIVYGLGPLVLDELAEQMGQKNFDALLKTYTQENFWEITSASDFFRLAEAYCSCTLANRGSKGELWFK